MTTESVICSLYHLKYGVRLMLNPPYPYRRAGELPSGTKSEMKKVVKSTFLTFLTFSHGDEHRYLGAVLAGVEHLLHLVVGLLEAEYLGL
jgi:hypothetical protein